MIAVAILPIVPSTEGFCFLSLIEDKKDYLQNQIIFNLGRIDISHNESVIRF